MTPSNVRGASIHKLADSVPKILFTISLFKELYEKLLCPLLADRPGFGGVTNVSHVEKLFAEELLLVWIRVIDFGAFDLPFKNANFGEMEGHIGRKNGTNHELSDFLLVVLAEFSKDIELIMTHNLKSCGDMEVLKDRCIVVSRGNPVFLLNMIDVIESHMANVMTSSCNDVRHNFDGCYVTLLPELTSC